MVRVLSGFASRTAPNLNDAMPSSRFGFKAHIGRSRVLGSKLKARPSKKQMCYITAASADDFPYESAYDASTVYSKELGMVDYYELLGLKDGASKSEVKLAYYGLAKECHPDILGDEGHDMCILLNDAYEILSDSKRRAEYNARLFQAKEDAADGFTGQARSKWLGPESETRALFVDECSCIGCKQCVWAAPATFRLEPDHGRSYVFGQWLNEEEELQTAVECCPVECIHWVDRAQLPVLEYVMHTIARVDVGIMQAGQGMVADPFDVAARFAKRRSEKLKQRAKESVQVEREQARKEKNMKVARAIQRRKAEAAAMFDRWKHNPNYTVPPERAIVPVSCIPDTYSQELSEEKEEGDKINVC